MTSRRRATTSAFAIWTRTVWSRVAGTSLPRAMMRISPFSSWASPNGGEAQPASICPDMAWVSVTADAPLAIALALTP